MLSITEATLLRDVLIKIRTDRIGLKAAENEVGDELLGNAISYCENCMEAEDTHTEIEMLTSQIESDRDENRIGWLAEKMRVHVTLAEEAVANMKLLTKGVS